MAKEPRERFQSYDEFIMALTSARSQLLVARFRPGQSSEPAAAVAATASRMRRWLGR